MLLALALVAGPACERAPSASLVVSAASSLTNVLQEIAQLYEQQSGVHVVLNFGASNTLARQIRAGAPVDLFISADAPQMDGVAADLAPGTRVDLLSNQLAIAVPDDRARRFTSARELTDAGIRRIAIGDPAAVPAGVYAKSYLQRIGVWTAVEPKVVPAGSVRLALAAVESGAADAAIVFRTDIQTAPRAREAFVVPRDEGPDIVYPAAVIRSGANADGSRRFLAFLRTSEAAAIFQRAGFIPLP